MKEASRFLTLVTLLGAASLFWPLSPAAADPSPAAEPSCPKGKKPFHDELSFTSGTINKFGEWANTCARAPSGALLMSVSARRGNYGMCCVDLQRPLQLARYATAAADVVVSHPEANVQVKLEDGPAQIRILEAAVESDTSRFEAWEFRSEDQELRPSRVCLVATEKGSTPTRLELRSISLRGCR